MCSCEEALTLISLELDEALTPGESERLRAHLASCADCSALARELREIHTAMRGMAAEVPPGFADAVMEKIRREKPARSAAPPAKNGRKRNLRIWGGLAAALVLAAVGAFHLWPLTFGGSASDSTAAAPEALTGTAGYAAADAESRDSAESADRSEPESTDETSNANATMEESFADGTPASETPSAEDGSTDTDASDTTRSFAAITGEKGLSLPGETQSPSAGSGDTALTAAEAGYKVLEAAAAENIVRYENTTEDNSLTLTAVTENGLTYHLTYLGISADGCSYQFRLDGADGSEQTWLAAVDGGGVVQK